MIMFIQGQVKAHLQMFYIILVHSTLLIRDFVHFIPYACALGVKLHGIEIQGRIQDFYEGGSTCSTRAKRVKNFSDTPTFRRTTPIVCVFNGCFSYRSVDFENLYQGE